MNFTHFVPTEIFFGRGCVREKGGRLKELGTHALIVTGKSSQKNGALADACAALEENGQDFTVFDRVVPNPTLACVREGIALAKSAGADFIVAIGGGSPMDAAKAIAILMKENRTDEEVFAGGYGKDALPMAHLPTTAGTGSEVTQYSILTNDFSKTKTSLSSPALFPKFAFLDGRYTDGLPRAVTVNTALDAFSHAVEGVLSEQSTPVSDALAAESMRRLYPLLRAAAEEKLGEPERDGILYASMLAGMTIAQSGTTLVHGMGYALTYFYGIDHGRANGLLLGETLRLCEKKNLPALRLILSACNEKSAEGICSTLDFCLGAREEIPRDRLEEFALTAMGNKNRKKSRYAPIDGEVRQIYLRSFGL